MKALLSRSISSSVHFMPLTIDKDGAGRLGIQSVEQVLRR